MVYTGSCQLQGHYSLAVAVTLGLGAWGHISAYSKWHLNTENLFVFFTVFILLVCCFTHTGVISNKKAEHCWPKSDAVDMGHSGTGEVPRSWTDILS